MRRVPWNLCWTAVFALFAGSAHAQVSEVAIARQLAIQGIDAVEAGDCKKGEPLLERAEQLHHASVHLQYLARCHANEGHLVIATEMWRQIVREGAPPGASQAVLSAINESNASLERTLPRLGSTTIRTADRYPGIKLVLDGTPIPPEIVGAPQAVDPGHHVLLARAAGFANFSHKWDVAEGGSAEVVVTMQPGQSDAEPETEATPTAPSDAGAGDKKSAFPLATVGWITASAGAAALVGGTVTLLTRNNRRDELKSKCPEANQGCPGYDPTSLKDSVVTLTTVTNILMFGGGALLAGGVTMIVLGSHSSSGGAQTALLAGGPAGSPGLTVQGKW
jgi:hypothetical protein